MAKYSTFIYGTSIKYGWSTILTAVTPDTGPSTGGQEFFITGEGFYYNLFDDDFTAAALDATKWTDISSGTGTATTGTNHLLLNSGATANGVGGIEMLNAHDDTQYECKVNVASFSSYPTATVNLFTTSLYVDANNYANLELNLYANKDLKLEASVYKGGVEVYNYSEDWTVGISTFKILRFGSAVYFYANGILFGSTIQFVSTSAKFRFFVDNRTAAYSIVNTIVEYVEHNSFAAFGSQVVHDVTTIGGTRLWGLTPPSMDDKNIESAYKGLVDISVVAGDTDTSTDLYEYYFLDTLTLLDSSQSGVKISIVGDDTVRTPADSTIGLGGGK